MIKLKARVAPSTLFLEEGIASIVTKSPGGRDVEIGLAGFEGMTGPSLALGVKSTPFSVYIQQAGSGYRIAADRFLAAIDKSRSLRDVIFKYTQAMIVRTATTVLVNSQADAETRMARWLLMVHDRTLGNDLRLTHEFMSVMLGVRRPWVTETLHTLESKGWVRASRGSITILDRAGLVTRAEGYYGTAESKYTRLLGVRLANVS